MTQEKSLNKNNGPIVTPAYLKHTVKNSWAVTLLIFIVMLLIATVPLLIEVDNINVSNYTESTYKIEELHRRLGNDLDTTAGTMLVISCISALFTGCYSLMFLHNKVSVGFFHSLPEKRSGHYITALVSAVTSYIIPLVVNFIVMLLALGAYGLLDGFAFAYLFKIILLSVFYFFVFLSITFFAGFLTGSSAIQAIFSVYIIAVLPVLYYSVLIWLDQSLSYLQISELADLTSVVSALSPAARIFTVAEIFNNPISVRSIIYLVLDTILTVLFFIGAYAVYKKRPVELAGTPVIYKPLSEAIKYTIIFASSLLLGYLFSEIGGSLWLIFGLGAGALLSFMLCNTVLNRNAKAMFSGIKGFLICCAVIIFVFIYASTGGFGFLDYVVPAASSVRVQLNGTDFVLTDKAEVAEFRRLMDELTDELKSGDIKTNSDYFYEKEYVVNVYDEESLKSSEAAIDNDTLAMAEGNRRKLTLYVTYHTPYGMDVPYRYYSVPYEHLTEILDLIKSSKDYSKFTTYAAGENFELNNVSLYFGCAPYKTNNSTASGVDPNAEKTENSYSGIPTVQIDFSISHSEKYISELYDEEKYQAELKPMYDAFCNFLNTRSAKDHNEPAVGYLRFDTTGAVYAAPEVYEILATENYITFDNYAIDIDYGYYGNTCPLYAEDIEVLFDILEPYADSIYIYTYDGYGLHKEIYDADEREELIGLLETSSAEDYVDALAMQTDYILVADHKDGIVTKIERKEQIKEILMSSVRIDESADISAFTKTDTDYNVFVVVEENVQYFHTYFREGMTPAFIK